MTISVHKHLRAVSLDIPEAAALIGKHVRVILIEEPAGAAERDMSALDRIAGKIDLDFEAIDDLRRRSSIE